MAFDRRLGRARALERAPWLLVLAALGAIAGLELGRGEALAQQPASSPPASEAAPDRATPGDATPSPDGPGTDGGADAPAQADAAPAAPEEARRRMIVIDAATYGIDPVVGRVVTERMRRTASELGYEVIDAGATVAAAQRLRMPYPPAPADLWRVTWVAQAHRGAFARVWAAEGRYVIEMTVASLDGTGPFFAREPAGASDLRDVVDRMLRGTLPAPSVWQEAPPSTVATTTSVPTVAPRRWRERPREELAHPGGIGVRLPEPPLRRLQLTLQTESVFGTTQGGFYNHLVGARVDVRITRDLLLGAYVGYANLQGRNDRADNLLMLIQGEQRIRVSPTLDLTIPLRVAVGYLPFNGPVVRLAAGINYALSEEWEIGADIVTPTFWILPNDVAVSLDVALEVTYRFPF